jgi:ABC-type multidrug transport system ATPase subunit
MIVPLAIRRLDHAPSQPGHATTLRKHLVVLDDLSFTVCEGQMFGFIGSNGAGKTTAMRIVRGR